MKANDVVIGIAVALFGAAVILLALGLPKPLAGAHIAYGPEFFPVLVGAALVLAGAGLALTGGGYTRPAVALGPEFRDWRRIGGLALAVAALWGFVAFGATVGFLPIAVVTLVALLVVGGLRPMKAIPLAVAGALLIHVLFARVLLVPLPLGILTPFAGWL